MPAGDLRPGVLQGVAQLHDQDQEEQQSNIAAGVRRKPLRRLIFGGRAIGPCSGVLFGGRRCVLSYGSPSLPKPRSLGGLAGQRRLLVQQLGFQVLASLDALALQEAGLQIGTFFLGYQPLFSHDLTGVHLMEILGTAALGPLLHLLVQGVTNSLRRLGWRPRSEPMPYQPFGE